MGTKAEQTMWILSLEWLMLAVLVFWVIGAFKRLKRLRAGSKQAFVAVEAQFMQAVDLLRHCARVQELKERVASVSVQHAHHALIPSADLLEAALQQAKPHPLRPEVIAALDSAWQGAQVAWQAYVQLASGQAEGPDDHVQEQSLRWSQLMTLQTHSTAQFNAAVQDYNRAIAQFPACVVARLSGLKAGRTFQKDAALLMQP